jgi:hypothetical protein
MGGQERDTQQGNSNTKLAAHKYNSCNSDAWQSEQSFSYVFMSA